MNEQRAAEEAYGFLRGHNNGDLRFDEQCRAIKYVIGPQGRIVAPLMLTMLNCGDAVLCIPADTDNPRGYFELEAVKRLPSATGWLDNAVGRAVKVVHALVSNLPDRYAYRVIRMRRRLEAVAASQRRMLERSGESADDLPEDRLIAVFRAQLEELEAWLAARRNFASLEIDFDALFDDPRPLAERVDRFLGGDLDVDAMVATVDPALRRGGGVS